MNIYIPTQTVTAGTFKMWLIKHLGIDYELEEEIQADKEATCDIIKVKETESEEEETPIMMENVMDILSTRASHIITVLLAHYKIKLSGLTVEDFADRFTTADLLKVQGCGKVTLAEIISVFEGCGHELQE